MINQLMIDIRKQDVAEREGYRRELSVTEEEVAKASQVIDRYLGPHSIVARWRFAGAQGPF